MASIYTYLILLCVQYALGQDLPLASTSQGLVRGRRAENGDYDMYLGIPYGLVNTSNPFGPSAPHPPFGDIFDAVDDSARCPQMGLTGVSGRLDCLHLNVFVPSNTSDLLPVLVFIHGGAFEFGSISSNTYGPKFLVRHDIIVVTLNYRLSVYGYMCTDNPRVPGNQGSRDQLLALRWIRDNIANFGGDPNRVTLSGNSAGSMSTDLLILSEEGSKLFQQAIMQSGVSFFPSYPTTIRNSPLILAERFGHITNDVDDALDYLATINPIRILLTASRLGLQFRPCIEKAFDGVEPFMTENWVKKEVVPTAKDKNIIVGFNENEALGLFLTPRSDLTNIVNESVSTVFNIDHEDFYGLSEVRYFFFGDEEIDSSKFKEAIDLKSDLSFAYNTFKSINRYLKSDIGKVYQYLFSHDGGRNLFKMTLNTDVKGAAHADEIGYLFDVARLGEPSVEDQLVIDRMTEMWANFVKYGDPTPEVTELLPVKWEVITPTSPLHYMHIDSGLTAGTSLNHQRMAFWNLFFEKNGHLHNFLLDNE